MCCACYTGSTWGFPAVPNELLGALADAPNCGRALQSTYSAAGMDAHAPSFIDAEATCSVCYRLTCVNNVRCWKLQIYDGARQAYASLAKQMEKHNRCAVVCFALQHWCMLIARILWQHASHLLAFAGCSSDSVKYFFGDQPSSVDAVLYPHLLYHHRSPVAAPELRKAVRPIIGNYGHIISQLWLLLPPIFFLEQSLWDGIGCI